MSKQCHFNRNINADLVDNRIGLSKISLLLAQLLPTVRRWDAFEFRMLSRINSGDTSEVWPGRCVSTCVCVYTTLSFVPATTQMLCTVDFVQCSSSYDIKKRKRELIKQTSPRRWQWPRGLRCAMPSVARTLSWCRISYELVCIISVSYFFL
jgi:hypothetical protein